MKVRCTYDQLVPISSLNPHPKNTNKHSKEQIQRLAKILEYQGWRYPIKVSKQSGFITSGHGRLEAAMLMKLDVVPVNFQDYENDTQELADLTSDNAIASWAELDLSLINLQLGDMGPDFDIDLLGIKNFNLDPNSELLDLDLTEEKEKQFRIEVKFPNEMEMMDIHDDLVSRGYMAKVLE